MSVPSLKGEIQINTSSVEKAINEVKDLQKVIERYSKDVQGSFGEATKGMQGTINAYRNLSMQTEKGVQQQDRMNTLIAKAANTVSNFQQALSRSNVDTDTMNKLFAQSATQLKGFEQGVLSGAIGGQRLDNIQTQLTVSLSEMKREMQDNATATKELNRAQETQARINSAAVQQTDRLTALIRTSAMESDRKAEATRRVQAAQQQLNSVLNNGQSTSKQMVAAQREFREEMNRVQIAVRSVNGEARKAELHKFATEMTNLSSSVQVALGPLSGIASRLTALSALFNRNAASLATFFAGMTAFSVSLGNSFFATQEAERQYARIGAQLEVLGGQAVFTADEIMDMGHRLADATLLSAQQARQSAGALLQFGGIARTQFEDVIKSAQGMVAVLGGGLTERMQLLARAIDDPVRGMGSLREAGVNLSKETEREIQNMVLLGNQYGATAKLLEEFTVYKKAAEAEANTMAGAIDAVGGALDKLYESLLFGSDGWKQAAKDTNAFAQSITAFAESPHAAMIRAQFESILSVVGRVVNFLIDNFSVLIGIFIGISATYIPRMLKGMISLVTMGLIPAIKAIGAKRKELASLGVQATSTARSMALLRTAVGTALPFVTAASAVGLYIYNLVRAKNAQEALAANTKEVYGRLIQDSNKLLQGTSQLPEAAKNVASAMVTGIEETYDTLFTKQEELVSKTKDLDEQLRSELKQAAGSKFYEEYFDPEGAGRTQREIKDITQLVHHLRRQGIYLTDEQLATYQSLLSVKGEYEEISDEMKDIQATIAEINKDPIAWAKQLEEANDIFFYTKDSLQKLREEYLSAEIQIEQYTTMIENLTATKNEMLKQSDNLTNATEDERNQFNLLLRVISELEKRLDQATGKTNKQRSAFDALAKSARDAERDIIKFSEGLFGGSVEGAELAFQLEDLKEQMNTLSQDELQKMATALRINSTDSDQLAAALLLQKMRADELGKSYAKYTSDIDTANGYMKSQGSAVDQLRDKYKALIASAENAGNSEAANKMRDNFKRASDQLRSELNEATNAQGSANGVEAFFGGFDALQSDLDRRTEIIRSQYANDLEMQQKYIDDMNRNMKGIKVVAMVGESFKIAGDLSKQGMELMSVAGKEGTSEAKRFARANIVLSQAMAIAGVWSQASKLPPGLNVAYGSLMTGMIMATMGAQLAAVNSAHYATGGYVSGDGTGTSDSIPAMLSNGEYVINAAAVRRLGIGNLDMMNEGRLPMMATGGMVGMPVSTPSSGGGNVSITIIDQSSGGKEYEQSEEMGADGVRNIRILIRDTVRDLMKGGEMDKAMSTNYGTNRVARRR